MHILFYFSLVCVLQICITRLYNFCNKKEKTIKVIFKRKREASGSNILQFPRVESSRSPTKEAKIQEHFCRKDLRVEH